MRIRWTENLVLLVYIIMVITILAIGIAACYPKVMEILSVLENYPL